MDTPLGGSHRITSQDFVGSEALPHVCSTGSHKMKASDAYDAKQLGNPIRVTLATNGFRRYTGNIPSVLITIYHPRAPPSCGSDKHLGYIL